VDDHAGGGEARGGDHAGWCEAAGERDAPNGRGLEEHADFGLQVVRVSRCAVATECWAQRGWGLKCAGRFLELRLADAVRSTATAGGGRETKLVCIEKKRLSRLLLLRRWISGPQALLARPQLPGK
jgi:hypothetical protein